MGATPCDDLSACKVGGLGLEGPNSSLFLDFIDLFHSLRVDNEGLPLALLAENVVPKPADRKVLEQKLGLDSTALQSAASQNAASVSQFDDQLKKLEEAQAGLKAMS